MSPDEKNDLLYLLNILEYIGKIWKYTDGVKCADELFERNDQMNLNASLTLLANIGENVSKLTDILKDEYQDVEWKLIKNFRNRIAHDYIGIDLVIVYEIVTKDLKTLKRDIEKIIRAKLREKIFDVGEVAVSRESKFYRHVEFGNIL